MTSDEYLKASGLTKLGKLLIKLPAIITYLILIPVFILGLVWYLAKAIITEFLEIFMELVTGIRTLQAQRQNYRFLKKLNEESNSRED